mmetsp:Transcript_25375/g.50565  ORF Transcript_25375/g.50565 Transcript_25375/m.50565 type:complete len:257 (+) Transcript_25375:90-860(+)
MSSSTHRSLNSLVFDMSSPTHRSSIFPFTTSYVTIVTAAAGAPRPKATCHPLSSRRAKYPTLPPHSTHILFKTPRADIPPPSLCTSVLIVSSGSAADQKPIPAAAPPAANFFSDGGSLPSSNPAGGDITASAMRKNRVQPAASLAAVTPAPTQSPRIPARMTVSRTTDHVEVVAPAITAPPSPARCSIIRFRTYSTGVTKRTAFTAPAKAPAAAESSRRLLRLLPPPKPPIFCAFSARYLSSAAWHDICTVNIVLL